MTRPAAPRVDDGPVHSHLLVSLGAAMFTVAGADVADADPARVAAQVVTGIGFLGAGATRLQALPGVIDVDISA